jgi:hypothetical protein
VQSVGAALPEFYRRRNDPIPAPLRRQLDPDTGEALRHFAEPRLQNAPGVDHLALVRNPRAELTAAWPGKEVRFRFCARSFLHPSGNANLPLQLYPVNDEGGLRIGLQFAAFAAVIVGKKNETALIETL